MLRRLTVIKFNKDRTFDDEIRSMAHEYDAKDNSADNSLDDDSNNTER